MFALPSPPLVMMAECSHDSTNSILVACCARNGARSPVAPFDREIEVAMIDGCIITCAGSRLRHGADWLDAEMLRQVDGTATHWRYGRRMTPPISRC